MVKKYIQVPILVGAEGSNFFDEKAKINLKI